MITAKAVCRIGVVERRFFSKTTRFAAREVSLKQFESLARGSAETIDSLVRIADGEQVPFRPGQASKNFDLGEVGVLKFVRENEPRAARASPDTCSSAVQ